MSKTRAPFLQRVETRPERVDPAQFPFTIHAFSKGIDLDFASTVTFFVGENGTGKSTLLEALAEGCGFDPEGGSRDHQRTTTAGRSPLLPALRLLWRPKVTKGFFLRAESFYNFATYVEGVSDMQAYGGKSLHAQSHGESFLALFNHRFEQGYFHPGRAGSGAIASAAALVPEDRARPHRDRTRAVPYRHQFTDHPRVSRRGALLIGW